MHGFGNSTVYQNEEVNEGKRKMAENLPQNDVVNVCQTAGKILLQSGAETYRVEDTMLRIANAYGYKEAQSHVTPTGIIFSMVKTGSTNFLRIEESSTNLTKVSKVNLISRQICKGELSIEEAVTALIEIDKQNFAYPLWLLSLAAAIVSGSFTIMFQGSWPDFFPAMVAGGLGFLAANLLHRWMEIQFFAEFSASLLIGAVAAFCLFFGIGEAVDNIIIGAVMPIVPGLLITNAIRDLMAGHLVAGLSKGAQAMLTAFAIGAGVATSLSLF